MKKVLVLLAMVLGATNMFAFEVNGIKYNVTSEGDLTVEVARKEYSGDIVIPESVTYNNKKYRVTSIGERAFAGFPFLKSLTIPKSIISVHKYAIYDLPRLESVNVNSKNIGCWFKGITSIKTVILGNNVETVGNEAFSGCGIRSLSIPNSVKSIGDYAFFNIMFLKSLTIPSSCTYIGKGAFENCIRLENLEISNGVKKIREYAFSNCRKLRKVIIPPSVTSIGLNAFDEGFDLTYIGIPSSLPSKNYRGAFPNSDYIHVYDTNGEQTKKDYNVQDIDNKEVIESENPLMVATRGIAVVDQGLKALEAGQDGTQFFKMADELFEKASSLDQSNTYLQLILTRWIETKMYLNDFDNIAPKATCLLEHIKNKQANTETDLSLMIMSYAILCGYYETIGDSNTVSRCSEGAVENAKKLLKLNPNDTIAKSVLENLNK